MTTKTGATLSPTPETDPAARRLAEAVKRCEQKNGKQTKFIVGARIWEALIAYEVLAIIASQDKEDSNTRLANAALASFTSEI